jgi:hypothetical protein
MGQDGVSSEHQYLMMPQPRRFPLSRPQYGYPLTPRSWRVTTTIGGKRTTHQVEATTAAKAILAGLELSGANSQLVACLMDGVWA